MAINPATPVGALEEIAGDLDHVLVMSVNPGFGGSDFHPRSESKIRDVRDLLDASGNPRRRSKSTAASTSTNAGRIVAAGATCWWPAALVFGPARDRATAAFAIFAPRRETRLSQ